MVKFIVGAWLLLFTIVGASQIFDFWRIDPSDGVYLSYFCEGSSCRSDQYEARVFYLFGGADRVLIRDSADIQIGCGAEKSSHVMARAVGRGESVRGVSGKAVYDRETQKTKVVNDLGVFFPCDAPKNASAYGFAVAVPVWMKVALADVRSSIGVAQSSLDVTY